MRTIMGKEKCYSQISRLVIGFSQIYLPVAKGLVETERIELSTSRLSVVRSSQLSYGPVLRRLRRVFPLN